MYKETLQYIIDFLTKKNISNMVVHGLRTSHHSHKYIHGATVWVCMSQGTCGQTDCAAWVHVGLPSRSHKK